jgi:hypothetical protein
MVQDCPHSQTMRCFARLLTISFKMVHSNHSDVSLPLVTKVPSAIANPAQGGEVKVTDSILRQARETILMLKDNNSMMHCAQVLHALLAQMEMVTVDGVTQKDGKTPIGCHLLLGVVTNTVCVVRQGSGSIVLC